jgi:hypothetical protein
MDISQELNNLVLCNHLREFAGFSKPVLLEDLSWKKPILKLFINCGLYIRRSQSVLIKSFVAPFILDPLILIVIRIILIKKSGPKTLRSIVKSVRNFLNYMVYRAFFYDKLSLLHFNINKDKNELNIFEEKNIILLLAMGRYGSATELLTGAFYAGIQMQFVSQWMSFLLREIGDYKTSEILIKPYINQIENEGANYVRHHSDVSIKFNTKLHNYGIIIPSMADSEVFQSSLISLLESDFKGSIVVVEDGINTDRACENFCSNLSIKYIKNNKHGGTSECYNIGIDQLDEIVDIIILAHNDILWPKHWFSRLTNIWDEVFEQNKVGMINLGYLQFSSNEILKELFIQRNYEYLTWSIENLKKVSFLPNMVQDVQVVDISNTFGLTYDPWNTDFDTRRIMAGRWSVAVSMPRKIWSDMGGASPNVFLADIEVQRHCMTYKKLMIWINNIPLIHCRSSDTKNLSPANLEKFRKMEVDTYIFFREKYGLEIEHFLSVLFSDTYITHWDAIIKAANSRNFSDVDFIYKYYENRI